MQPEARHSAKGECWVQYQPLGVIGIVIPWNFPINLAFKGLSDAISAGNRVMIKASEYTPKTSELLKRMIESVFDESEVAVITGGPEVGHEFCLQPFDKLLFTGSTSIGKHVMRAAAENLVPVILELGGKSPTILSRSAEFEKSVHKIIAGKAHNAGQICLSPDYVFVPEEQLEAFIDTAVAALPQYFPNLRDNPDYTSIINGRHFERIKGYVNEAREHGTRIIEINPANEDFADQEHHKLPVTLIIDPSDDLQVMQDEIFGPLLPVKPYKNIDEVIHFINQRPRPLAIYWFGTDNAERDSVLQNTTSGGVTINDVIKHVGIEELPFGGVGASGMGSYHGIDGFKALSHGKAVFVAQDGPDPMRPSFEATSAYIKSLITR
jgi:coniferyl-aldehyde dehydrogenase